MVAKLPTLSTSGFVSDIAEKADRLLSYYFVSDVSQTNLYRGEVVSLPAQVQAQGHDETYLAQLVQRDLEKLFRPYFDLVDVEVRTDLPAKDDPNRINVTVAVIVTQDGKQYSLGRLVTITNSKITQIVDINNNQGA